jgi:hypothetical protein
LELAASRGRIIGIAWNLRAAAMTSVIFPVPYKVDAVFDKFRNPREIEIADHATLEIRDVSKLDAPVLVSLQASYHNHRYDLEAPYDSYPRTELRMFEGEWYAPLLRFPKNGEMRAVTPDDFSEYFSPEALWSTVVNSTGYTADGPESRIRRQQTGRFPTLAEAKLRKVEKLDEKREEAKAWAQNQLESFINVEGTVYEKLKGEPALQYWKIGADSAVVLNISIGRAFSRDDVGYFTLDRLDDCLEHIGNLFPGRKLMRQFGDIQIENGVEFTYDDEGMAIRGALGDVKSALFWERDLDEGLRGLKARVDAFSEEQGENLDAVADLVQDFVRLAPADFKKRDAVVAAITRWEMRPMDTGFRI